MAGAGPPDIARGCREGRKLQWTTRRGRGHRPPLRRQRHRGRRGRIRDTMAANPGKPGDAKSWGYRGPVVTSEAARLRAFLSETETFEGVLGRMYRDAMSARLPDSIDHLANPWKRGDAKSGG